MFESKASFGELQFWLTSDHLVDKKRNPQISLRKMVFWKDTASIW